ncbi:hypothetical protein IMZ48_30665 [Candidatus Bathyarchaeota archaeon]|nr:hypothetical protein [Candidatus Bathyarchaeota archaeon]
MFDTLFDWARQGHEKTLNQRIRPGLIIILNKSTEIVHNALGTPEQATSRMLDAYAKSSKFRDMQRMWEKRGLRIKTAEDLIRCYYFDFKVVSIPTYTSSPLVATQMAEALKGLYRKILDMSACIRKKRRTFSMDPDVSTFNSHVEYAAKKLAKDYKATLNFHYMQMSSGKSSLPSRFSEHLVQLMSNMANMRGLDGSNEIGGEAQLVEDIVPFIASCIVAQVSQTDSSKLPPNLSLGGGDWLLTVGNKKGKGCARRVSLRTKPESALRSSGTNFGGAKLWIQAHIADVAITGMATKRGTSSDARLRSPRRPR